MNVAAAVLVVAALVLMRRRPRWSLALAMFLAGWVLTPAAGPTVAGGRASVRVLVVNASRAHPTSSALPGWVTLKDGHETETAAPTGCESAGR